ncbi:MAG: DUF86 domain-containing protein [Euryarchaeota archaeon]|nr:DUF86 domain-containing protein [Euryarchaeota archaeon]
MKRDELFLRHILEESEFILRICGDLTYDRLCADPVMQRAVIRFIEIIGEATKNLSNTLKEQYPDVPQRLIAGTRDKLIHAYFEVDRVIVWNILQSEIPVPEESVHAIPDVLSITGR